MKKLFSFLSLLLALPLQLLAQNMPQPQPGGLAGNDKIWVVVLVLATIFAGIIAFLIYLDRKLQKLEKKSEQQIISK